MISRIVHQSWKTANIPYHVYNKRWIASWKTKNPDWEYKLWTNLDNFKLIRDHYPEFLELYNSYSKDINRADMARYFYMHKYGGIYADLDFQCLKNMDDLVAGHTMILGRQHMSCADSGGIFDNDIPNAFKYSVPGEEFWLQCAKELASSRYDTSGNENSTEVATGPIFLKRCIEKFQPVNLTILDPQVLYPVSWEADGSAAKKTIKPEWVSNPSVHFPDSYAITFWTCAWRPGFSIYDRAVPVSHSQLGQDKIVLKHFNFKQDGFFVEAGALNGVDNSNTYILEKKYGWKGICCEPNDDSFRDLRTNRSCRLDSRLLWDKDGEEVAFHKCGGISGVPESFQNEKKHLPERLNSPACSVVTISLDSLLRAHNAPRCIDYISLDTEGSELKILKAFDFDAWEVEMWSIEHNAQQRDDGSSYLKKIVDLMSSKGYDYNIIGHDLICKRKTMQGTLSKVSKAVYINLDHRQDRDEFMKGSLPFEAERVSAVNGNDLSLTPEIEKLFGDSLKKLSKGEVGCILSHYYLWQRLVMDNSSSSYLILEDDAVFKDNFVEEWNTKYAEALPKGFFIIYLGGSQPWNASHYSSVLSPHNPCYNNIKLNDHFSENDHYWHMTTSSYLLSKEAACLLCQYVEQFGFDRALDHFLVRFFTENKVFSNPERLYHTQPLLCRQRHEAGGNTSIPADSDIRHNVQHFTLPAHEDDLHKPLVEEVFGGFANFPSLPFSCHISIDNLRALGTEPFTSSSFKVLILGFEPYEVIKLNNLYTLDKVIDNHEQFDLILCSYEKVLEKCPNSERFAFGSSWLDYNNYVIPPREYGVSFICGAKNTLEGHRLRHKIFEELDGKLDIPHEFFFSIKGSGSWIDHNGNEHFHMKEEAFSKYQYQIVVENSSHRNYFTEKIIDCFVSKTIPIYWGCKNITNFFKSNGVLEFDNIEELRLTLDALTPEYYAQHQAAVSANYFLGKYYADPVSRATQAIKDHWSSISSSQDSNNGKLTLIWQANPPAPASFNDCFEHDWLMDLFGDHVGDVINDGKWEIICDNSLIVYSDMFAANPDKYDSLPSLFLQQKRDKQAKYFEKAKNLSNCHLVHLSDEFCHAPIDHYKYFSHVFRQYYRPDAAAHNVSFVPLGYKLGFHSPVS